MRASSLKLCSNQAIVQSMKSEDDVNNSTSHEFNRASGGGGVGNGPSRSGSVIAGRIVQRQGSTGFGSKKKKTKFTTCQIVKSSLTNLFNEVSNSKLHFIRCIKPNNEQNPNTFSRQLVLHQLEYSGLFDYIQIKEEGFIHQYNWNDLVNEIKNRECLCGKILTKVITSTSPNYIRNLLRSFVSPEFWFEGKSGIIYLKSTFFDVLKLKKGDISAGVIQKNWRTHRLPIELKILLHSLQVIQRTMFKFFVKVQKIKEQRLQFFLVKKYYFFIRRWYVQIRIQKRQSANIIIRTFRYKRVKASLHHILKSQEIITNFLQTKRLKQKFILQKKSAILIQTSIRGLLCRKQYQPIIQEVRARMYQRHLQLSSKKIYWYNIF